jgi:hypothetical protein
VNWSAVTTEDVPLGVVTFMSTVPAEPEGAVAVICPSLFTVKLVAFVVPNLTAVAPVKFVPAIVTTVPPEVVPVLGDTAVTAGAEVVT